MTETSNQTEAFDLPSIVDMELGDPAPIFALPDADGETVGLNDDLFAGRPMILMFLSGPQDADAMAALAAFNAEAASFAEAQAMVIAIAPAPQAAIADFARQLGLNLVILADADAATARAYQVKSPGATVFVLDGNRRVESIMKDIPADIMPAAALEIVRELTAARPAETLSGTAPVLIVPNVLSAEECRWLISLYEQTGQSWRHPDRVDEGGFAEDFKVPAPDQGRVDRVDHVINDSDVLNHLATRINRRVLPEIEKAFHYPVTRREYWRITSYEGRRGGQTIGHRDNPTEEYAHRRFAISINLNSEEFEGGELMFREFSDQRFKPPSGAALVFSSGILHEAQEVTAGRRMVLLSQLFGER